MALRTSAHHRRGREDGLAHRRLTGREWRELFQRRLPFATRPLRYRQHAYFARSRRITASLAISAHIRGYLDGRDAAKHFARGMASPISIAAAER